MSAKVFPSQKPGHCSICNQDFPAGTRIVKDNKAGKYVMADCLFPNKIRGNGGAQAPPAPKPELTREQPVNKNGYTLDEATGEAKAILNIASSQVMYVFGLKDKSQLKGEHLLLIAEGAKQIFNLRHWIAKRD